MKGCAPRLALKKRHKTVYPYPAQTHPLDGNWHSGCSHPHPPTRRLMRRDEHTGKFKYSAVYSNRHYHLDFSHIQQKTLCMYIEFAKYQTRAA